jgi:hypothetical protein
MTDYAALLDLEKKRPQPTSNPPPLEEKENKSASLLANQQTSKEASKQTNKLASKQISKSANLQTSKSVNQQTSLPTNQQTSKLLKKFGSYLTEESLRSLKRIAFDTDRKDYEVLQEAVDQYIEKVKK